MTWGRIDDGARTHAKMDLAKKRAEKTRRGRGDACVAMYRQAIDYCNENGTDGFLTIDSLECLTCDPRPLEIAELLAGAIVKPNGRGLFEKEEGGYLVHDFLDFNDSAEEVRHRKEAAKQRMKARRSGGVRANTQRTISERTANDLGTNSEVRKTFLAGDPDPSRPVPTLCVEPHAREPVTSEHRVPSSPLSASVLAALRSHPTLDIVANPDVSDMLTGRAVASGKRVEWVVASIAAVAADVTGQSLNAGALVQKVRSYVDRSRAPEADKRAGTNAGPTLPPKFNPRIHGSGAA